MHPSDKPTSAALPGAGPHPSVAPARGQPSAVRLVQGALASALALGLGQQVALAHQGKPNQEACYGIAKAGENMCSNLLGTHECAGESTTDRALDEWTYVAKGTCRKLKGYSKAEAEARLKRLAAAARPQRGGVAPGSPPAAASSAAPGSSR